MFSLLGTLVVGLIVGLIARALKPGDDRMGWIMTSILGVAGSFLASAVGTSLGWYRPGQPVGWIASVLGAMALLFIYSLIKKQN